MNKEKNDCVPRLCVKNIECVNQNIDNVKVRECAYHSKREKVQRTEPEGAAERGAEVEGVYSYLDNMGISMRGPEVKSRLDQHEYVWIKE